MQFTLAVVSAILATAFAAPAPQTTGCPNPAHCGTPADPSTYENVDVDDLYIRKNNGIQSASFKLSGANATDITCEIGAVPELPSKVVGCGDSDYRFGLTKGKDSEFGLAIYHQTSAFAGKMQIADAPTYCHAGGNGPDDFVCNQVNPMTFVITSMNFPGN